MATQPATTAEQAWQECLKIIRDNVTREEYERWFKPLKAVRLNGQELTLRVPSHFYYEWLEQHYVSLLARTLRRVLGAGARLKYEILTDAAHQKAMVVDQTQPEHYDPTLRQIADMVRNPYALLGMERTQIPTNLKPTLTFETFVEGPCNRLARNAGLAIAQEPGRVAFNPFVVYSDVGLGKTHLVQAIGNEILKRDPAKLVVYTSGEAFTSQFVQMVKKDAVTDFMQLYYNVDVLILDDVHHLAGKEKTQEVLFHIFNFLHQNGKQIILTTDQPPARMKGFSERLLSRFRWGLTAQLEPPDYETRKKILLNRLRREGVSLPEEVIDYIAANVEGSIRDLEGVLISLLAHLVLCKAEVTLDLVRQIITQHVPATAKQEPVSLERIAELVTERTGVTLEEMRSRSRQRRVSEARQLAMFLAKQFTSLPAAKISQFFGRADHTAVVYACKQVERQLKKNVTLQRIVEGIKKDLQNV